jgi:hypothetical protein
MHLIERRIFTKILISQKIKMDCLASSLIQTYCLGKFDAIIKNNYQIPKKNYFFFRVNIF